MPSALSLDLRQRVIAAVEAGTSCRKAAARFTNPKAIILGRDRRPDGTPALDASQALDLEIIKRKYANMAEIMTYDDLLRRLDNVVAGLRRKAAEDDAAVPATAHDEGTGLSDQAGCR